MADRKKEFEDAKKIQASLQKHVDKHSARVKAFDKHRNPMGLLPEHIRTSPEYRAAKNDYDTAFNRLRHFNSKFVPHFKELREEKRKREERTRKHQQDSASELITTKDGQHEIHRLGPAIARTEHEGGKWHLHSLRVPAKHRKQGHAQRMMHALTAHADKHGHTMRLLSSPLDKKTHWGKLDSFYRKHGFERTGETVNGIPVVMERKPKTDESALISDKAADMSENYNKALKVYTNCLKSAIKKFPDQYKLYKENGGHLDADVVAQKMMQSAAKGTSSIAGSYAFKAAAKILGIKNQVGAWKAFLNEGQQPQKEVNKEGGNDNKLKADTLKIMTAIVKAPEGKSFAEVKGLDKMHVGTLEALLRKKWPDAQLKMGTQMGKPGLLINRPGDMTLKAMSQLMEKISKKQDNASELKDTASEDKPFINVKPLDKNQIYTTEDQAIHHVISNKLGHNKWNYGGKSFGQTIEHRRKVNEAVKNKDKSAFKAHKRRGYWRVELADKNDKAYSYRDVADVNTSPKRTHIGWKKPTGTEEHDEVLHQSETADHPQHLQDHLKKLSNPEPYKKALASGKSETFTKEKFKNVNNTDADTGKTSHLDRSKVSRVYKKLDSGQPMTSPIVLRHKATGHMHLLAGNTRATVATKHGHSVTAHVMEY